MLQGHACSAPGYRKQVFDAWKTSDTPCPTEASIHELFESQATQTPNAVAASSKTSQITYRVLNARQFPGTPFVRWGVGLDKAVAICDISPATAGALAFSRADDPEMGWGRPSEAGVAVRMIPGVHYNILAL